MSAGPRTLVYRVPPGTVPPPRGGLPDSRPTLESRSCERPQLKPSESLLKQVTVLKWEHKKAGDEMKMDRTALDLQLGALLVKKNSSPKELVVAWDRKLKGCINKVRGEDVRRIFSRLL